AAQRVGIPLATIREALAELPEERTPTREDWAHLSEAWRSELDERIKQLNRLRDHLTDCIGCGCLSLATCVLSNP
ncbi:redox-sensitive transcriptional activator SoxR, partial [Streptomyces sp. JV178]